MSCTSRVFKIHHLARQRVTSVSTLNRVGIVNTAGIHFYVINGLQSKKHGEAYYVRYHYLCGAFIETFKSSDQKIIMHSNLQL